MTFNYLRDAPPDAIARVRAMRIPAPLHAPLLAFATAAIAVTVVTGMLSFRLSGVLATERRAQIRFDSSKAVLIRERLESTRVAQLLSLDSHLRAIRRSGVRVATRFATIANHLPRQAWLTSISHSSAGMEIVGQVRGITTLAETLTGLHASNQLHATTLVRTAELNAPDASDVFTFELRIADNR